MTGPAPRVEADALRRAVNLLDLMPSGVALKRIGKDAYVTLCVFHGEDRPSMRVTLYRGVWRFHCFPCGAKGDAIEFVQRSRGLSFKEAIAALVDGRTFDLDITTPTKRRAPPWLLACSSPGCTVTREGETQAALLLEALCAGWIVCAAEEAAFDYCTACARRLAS